MGVGFHTAAHSSCEDHLLSVQAEEETYQTLALKSPLQVFEFNQTVYLTLRRMDLLLDLKNLNNREARKSQQLQTFVEKLNHLVKNWDQNKKIVREVFDQAHFDLSVKDPSPLRFQIQLLTSKEIWIKQALDRTLLHSQNLLKGDLNAKNPDSIFATKQKNTNGLHIEKKGYALWTDLLKIAQRCREVEFKAKNFDECLRNFQSEFKDFMNSDQTFEEFRLKAHQSVAACCEFGMSKFPVIQLIDLKQKEIEDLHPASSTLRDQLLRSISLKLKMLDIGLNAIDKLYDEFYLLFKKLESVHSKKPNVFYHEDLMTLFSLVETQIPIWSYQNSSDEIKKTHIEFERLNNLRSEFEELSEMAQLYTETSDIEFRDQILNDYFVNRYSPADVLDYVNLVNNPSLDSNLKQNLIEKLIGFSEFDHAIHRSDSN